MQKYCKVADIDTKLVSVGVGTNRVAYEELGYTLKDVEQAHDGSWYLSGYAPQPSEADLFESLRIATQQRLATTDQYGMDDYPDNEKRAAFRVYRADLRALNHQPGAPWGGGGELTPWPELPSVG